MTKTNKLSRGGPGGGYGSKQHVKTSIKTGSGSHSTRPSYVAQLGNKVGSHVTNTGDTGYRGAKFHDQRNFQPVKFGNSVALNVGKGGCGTGRKLYGQAGSQGQHRNANPGNPPPNARRDALEQE
jgi:hypothetical protein